MKDIQAYLRHARPDTTANECMQALPASVQQLLVSVYRMLTKGEGEKQRFCGSATKWSYGPEDREKTGIAGHIWHQNGINFQPVGVGLTVGQPNPCSMLERREYSAKALTWRLARK
ncbi:hypothetical protein [Bryocella elongata]|uniref:hypothetical protein n=1 Tax=Bryocella elongata TaxID=863522 RepID=UPI0011B019EA|nr:hypothetical protein [Bryocella elongata]